ncbi:hypothetical protein FNYG_15181 [Fusarium nygamai]|uniref:Tc1-like transposase DDE domain-containing protein n=1 Tax=Gibberella nygamai TaxID=42673 RepID=A0A2K0UIZ6_GIBNY|nr:hypothetical protein FNYG_15181 [Fusarium nygamai]
MTKTVGLHDIIFSSECHWGFGDEGQLYIARKPGTADEPSNLQESRAPTKKQRKRVHGWAAIGYDFKSDLYLYDIATNGNGKMTQQVYLNNILKPFIRELRNRGRYFVLEEDGDSGHGLGKNNPVRAWKEQEGLEYYFNCSGSPDFAPIENAWKVPKQYTRQYPHWDTDTLVKLVKEGWKELKQETINR